MLDYYFWMLDHPQRWLGGPKTLSKFDSDAHCSFFELLLCTLSIWLENPYLGHKKKKKYPKKGQGWKKCEPIMSYTPDSKPKTSLANIAYRISYFTALCGQFARAIKRKHPKTWLRDRKIWCPSVLPCIIPAKKSILANITYGNTYGTCTMWSVCEALKRKMS